MISRAIDDNEAFPTKGGSPLQKEGFRVICLQALASPVSYIFFSPLQAKDTTAGAHGAKSGTGPEGRTTGRCATLLGAGRRLNGLAHEGGTTPTNPVL
jgi:hypothetical protein